MKHENLEQIIIDEIGISFDKGDKEMFCKDVALLFTNRTMPQRTELAEKIYEIIKK